MVKKDEYKKFQMRSYTEHHSSVPEVFHCALLFIKRCIYQRRHSRRHVQTRLFVCLFVRALTGKRLELSTPNLVHVYSIAVSQHALTLRSKGQGHTAQKPCRTVASADNRQ